MPFRSLASRIFRALASLGLFALLASPLRAGNNVWTPIGPEGGIVWQVVADPSAPGTLYAGGNGGIFKSTDGGTTWVLSSRGLGSFSAFELAVDPHQAGHLFVVTAGFPANYIYRSTDGAATWQAPDNPLSDFPTALAVDPQNGSTVYAGTPSAGFWRSTDGGKSWQKRSATSLNFASLAVDPLHPETLYAGTGSSSAVVRSTDGGATWVGRSAALPSLQSGRSDTHIALDPESPEILYATVRYGNGKPAQTFRSADAGLHWQLATGPGALGGLPLATGPGGAVYSGAARSLDHGVTWKRAILAPGTPLSLSVAPSSPTTLYTASADGVYRSTDASLSWQRLVHGLNGTFIRGLGVRPFGQPLVYAGVEGLGIARTRPSGSGWARLNSDLLLPPNRFIFDPTDSGLVYAQTRDQTARSTDDGQTWELLALPAPPKNCVPSGIQAFDVAKATPGKSHGAVYAGVTLPGDRACKGYCTAYKSLDRGNTWSCLPIPAPGMTSLAVAPSSPSIVYASQGQRLLKSIDAGVTWIRIDRNLLRIATGFDLAAVDPTNAQVVYLFSTAGLLKSQDGGLTWTILRQGLPDAFFQTLVIDPSNPANLWTGFISDGVYRSVDGGLHWHPQNGGLHGFSGGLALDPNDPNVVYAGTPSNGTYTLTIVP